MNEVRRVCRQTGRWASIEGGRCRSDCSVLPHVVPETARSSSAGLVQPVGSGPACVFEMQLRQIQPARCWSSYIRCCPNLGWDGALLTPFTPNPPTSNPRSSAPGDELRNENKVEKGTKCYGTLQMSYLLSRWCCWELKDSPASAALKILMHPLQCSCNLLRPASMAPCQERTQSHSNGLSKSTVLTEKHKPCCRGRVVFGSKGQREMLISATPDPTSMFWDHPATNG